MPPIPRPSQRGSKSSGHNDRASRKDRTKPPASEPSSPTGGTRRGATSDEVLRVKVERMYMVVGTALSPMGRFFPPLTPIGANVKEFSAEASQAWIELAKEDARVRDALIAMTAASSWGNVIGIHIAIFSGAVITSTAQAGAMSAVPNGGVGDFDINDMLDSLTPEERQAAFDMAARMTGQPMPEMPIRDMGTGGPGDTIQATVIPEPPEQSAQPSPQPAPSRPGIVTPDELGVQQPTQTVPFPADGTLRGA